jgi:hypothetical protein
MAITISIPKNNAGITLQKFVAYQSGRNEVERVMAATGQSRRVVEGFKMRTLNELIDTFDNAIKVGVPMHQQTVVINGVRLGFIPDLNDLTLREHIDLDTYAQEIWTKDGNNYTNLPKLMAILFRRVTDIFGNYYRIEPYDSERVREYIDIVNLLTMDKVNGALVFFSTIVKELGKSGAEYLTEALTPTTTEGTGTMDTERD